MKETMTSRERVLCAVNHQQPDRVPIDLGGFQTGIHVVAYRKLLGYLGIQHEVRILDPVQQLARVLIQKIHKMSNQEAVNYEDICYQVSAPYVYFRRHVWRRLGDRRGSIAQKFLDPSPFHSTRGLLVLHEWQHEP